MILLILFRYVGKIIWFCYLYLILMSKKSIEVKFLWQGNQAKLNHFHRIPFLKTTITNILQPSKKGKNDKKLVDY